MVIPSGDLAPMRKHRRYGRRRRRWPVVLGVLAVVAVAVGVYALQQRSRDNTAQVPLAACPSATPSAVTSGASTAKEKAVRLPAPGQVSLRLLNGTGRDRLARAVGDDLARRGFRVTQMGNAPRALVGASRVYYGPGARPAALLVTAHVLDASVVPVPSAAAGAIDVVLGSAFVRLRTAPETAAYVRQLTTSGGPAAKPAVKPIASPTCR